MKIRLSTLVSFLAIMAIPLAAQAQGKIGVINFSAAIGTTAEGKKSIADLQSKYAPRKQELMRLQQEIQSDQDQLSKQTATLSDDEQRRLQRDLEDKQKLLKRSTDDAQSDYNADMEESVRKIGQKMTRVIGEYAQQNGFVLVIDDAQIPVYYVSKDLDISAEMVKRYDAAYPVAETPASSKPPATPSK
jgi:outer membrane protein